MTDEITYDDLERLETDTISMLSAIRKLRIAARDRPASSMAYVRDWSCWKDARSEFRTYCRRSRPILGKRRRKDAQDVS